MNWEQLSLNQVKTVLLEGRPECEPLRRALKEQLRKKTSRSGTTGDIPSPLWRTPSPSWRCGTRRSRGGMRT